MIKFRNDFEMILVFKYTTFTVFYDKKDDNYFRYDKR